MIFWMSIDMTEFKYVGSELELFSDVHNWKSYWSSQIRSYVVGDVLEVGAGIGANTRYLHGGGVSNWVCLEPDRRMVEELTRALRSATPTLKCEVVCGTLRSLLGRQFDTIVYIDVLEHIEDDTQELADAAALLRSGGRIIVVAPAHQSLFTPFDAAVGHFRRYDRESLNRISPAGMLLENMRYLDSAGLLLSFANRFFLRQSMPTKAQLGFWDIWVIPLSKVLDTCLLGAVGKSIVAVWRK
jgi:SAM-dependent methyltransferase